MASGDSTYQITGKFSGVNEIIAGYQKIDASVKQVAGSMKVMADLTTQIVANSRQSSTGLSTDSRQRTQHLKGEAALLDLIVTGYDRLATGAKNSQFALAGQLDLLLRNVGAQLSGPAGSSTSTPAAGPQTGAAKTSGSGLEAGTGDGGIPVKEFMVKASVVNLTAGSVNLKEDGSVGGEAGKGGKGESGEEKTGDQRIIERIKKEKELFKQGQDIYKESKDYIEKLKQGKEVLDRLLGIAVPTGGGTALGGVGIGVAGGGVAGGGAATAAGAGTVETVMGVPLIQGAGGATIMDGATFAPSAGGILMPEAAPGAGGAAATAEGVGLVGAGVSLGLLALPFVAAGAMYSNWQDKREMAARTKQSQANIAEYSKAFEAGITGMSDEQIRAAAEATQNQIVLEQVRGLNLDRSGKGVTGFFGLNPASEFDKTLAWASGKESVGSPDGVNKMGQNADNLKPEQRGKPWRELKQPLAQEQLVKQLQSLDIPNVERLKLFLHLAEGQLQKAGLGDTKDALEAGARGAYPKLYEQIDKEKAELEKGNAEANERAHRLGFGSDAKGVHGTFSTPAADSAAPSEGKSPVPQGGAPAPQAGPGAKPAGNQIEAQGGLAGLLGLVNSVRGLSKAYGDEIGVVKQLADSLPKVKGAFDGLNTSADTAAGAIKGLSTVLSTLQLPPGTTPVGGSGGASTGAGTGSARTGPMRAGRHQGYHSGHPVGSHAEGGLVKQDHTANIHQGELITRAPDVSKLVAAAASGGLKSGGHTVTISVDARGAAPGAGEEVKRAVMEALRAGGLRELLNDQLKDRNLMV
jgi:hypothetical protein